MNIINYLICVIISLVYLISFVWEMKQGEYSKRERVIDNKYYSRNHSNERNNQNERQVFSRMKIIIGK